MNITFIFGNGFDIQMGLKTRYSDFLEKYVVIKRSDSRNIVEFKKYLYKTENRRLWSDAEKAMGLHLGEFNDKSLEMYRERVADFEAGMVEYLKLEQEKCSFEKREDIKRVFLDFLTESFNDIFGWNKEPINVKSEKVANKYKFITFNYTNVLEKIVQCCVGPNNSLGIRCVSSGKVEDTIEGFYHVHGKLLNREIIMGVNDEKQLNLTGGVTLTDRLRRQIIKPSLNSVPGMRWDEPGKIAISESDIIAIYGISFGETDNMWWEEIKHWLEEKESHRLMIFIIDPNIRDQLVWEKIDYEEDLSRKYLQMLGFDPCSLTFNERLEQICFVVNTSRLNLSDFICDQFVGV